MHRRKMAILYTDAGYGHVATANVLKREMENAHSWEVILIDPYRETLAVLDPYLRVLGKSGPDIYNDVVLRRGHTTIFWPCFAALSQFLCVLGLAVASRKLAAIWREKDFDL